MSYGNVEVSCSDLGRIDEFFPFQCEESITICLEVIGTLLIATWANWISLGFNLILQ